MSTLSAYVAALTRSPMFKTPPATVTAPTSGSAISQPGSVLDAPVDTSQPFKTPPVQQAAQGLGDTIGSALSGAVSSQGLGQAGAQFSQLDPDARIRALAAAIRNSESHANYGEHHRFDAQGHKIGADTASGAYQYIDPTWGNYGNYAHAYQAPQAVQDRKAFDQIRQVLAEYGGDPRKVFQYWYSPKYVGQDNAYPGGNNGGITMGQMANLKMRALLDVLSKGGY